jgi:hypothetical protein
LDSLLFASKRIIKRSEYGTPYPSGSDVSNDSSDEDDNLEDINCLVHMRYRGIEALPQPGLGMFRDLYKGVEFSEDGGDEVGDDGDVSSEAGDDQTGYNKVRDDQAESNYE